MTSERITPWMLGQSSPVHLKPSELMDMANALNKIMEDVHERGSFLAGAPTRAEQTRRTMVVERIAEFIEQYFRTWTSVEAWTPYGARGLADDIVTEFGDRSPLGPSPGTIIDNLDHWIHHDPDCDWQHGVARGCSCGLTAAELNVLNAGWPLAPSFKEDRP